jgi:hypothetical protein
MPVLTQTIFSILQGLQNRKQKKKQTMQQGQDLVKTERRGKLTPQTLAFLDRQGI